MSKPNWKILAAIILVTLSLITHADPYHDATAGLQPVVNQSYFGTHFHRIVLTQDEIAKKYQKTEWPPNLIGTIRLWDTNTRWADIAPNPGQWDFSRIDTYVEQAAINHAAVMYTLGSTPKWASARKNEKCPYGYDGCSAEPAKMSDWEEYVRRVARRYKSKIAIYELWNEPYFSDFAGDNGQASFFTGSSAQMVEMARIARKVLDQEDPNAKLSTPGFAGDVRRLEMFLVAGGKKYVQAVAYHFYNSDSKNMANTLIDIRKVMQNQGVANLPLLNTEAGVEVLQPNSPPYPYAAQSQAEAAGKIAQYLILGAAGGIQQYYQYAWDNGRMGMVTPQRVRLPTYNAYVKSQSWLVNSKMLGCQSIAPNGVVCQSQKAGELFMYVWAEKPGIYAITLPGSVSMASTEKLSDMESQVLPRNINTLKLNLGDEPVRVLLKMQ